MDKPIPQDLAELVTQLEDLKADLAFVRALRRLSFVTTAGPIPLQYNPGTDNCVVDLRTLTVS